MSPRAAVLLLLALALVATGCSGSTDRPAPESTATIPPTGEPGSAEPRAVLPTGGVPVDVMEVVLPPRATELGARFQAAASENPDWFRAHVAASQPGQPLEYDARLGLSREEYAEFLKLSTQMTMQRTGRATLGITASEDGVYVLDGGSALPDLTGIEIDLVQDVVRTPFGVATDRTAVDADGTSPLGAWQGTQWGHEEMGADGSTGTIVKLAVGRLAMTGRGVLYYDVKAVRADGNTRIMRVLNYDLPGN